MIEILGILVLVVLFVAFPFISRENERSGGCGLCDVKKTPGPCADCPLDRLRRDEPDAAVRGGDHP